MKLSARNVVKAGVRIDRSAAVSRSHREIVSLGAGRIFRLGSSWRHVSIMSLLFMHWEEGAGPNYRLWLSPTVSITGLYGLGSACC